MSASVIVELDDLWHWNQIPKLILPLKEINPEFRATVFAVPNKLGPLGKAKDDYSFLSFGIHGFEHTHFECLEWAQPKAEALIQRALDMGYDPVFKAPNHGLTDEVADACAKLGVALVHNKNNTLKRVEGLKSFYTPPSNYTSLIAHLVYYRGTTDYIENHSGFLPESLSGLRDFKTILEVVNGN